MAKVKGLVNDKARKILLAAVVIIALCWIFSHLAVFGYMLVVLIGFGAVILVHEFGHFICAKCSGIKVEAFSIGFGPALFTVMKTDKGIRIGVLPEILGCADNGDAKVGFVIGGAGPAGETQYRVSLIPLGGYVKMLGQEDTGMAEASDDPRSFANKSVGSRFAVVAAGVVFNAISAVIVFVIIFLIGINLYPPVVGGVIAGSPAARAGIKAGDEIVAINGKDSSMDLSDVKMASAFSKKDEPVLITVKHQDGSRQEHTLVAEKLPGQQLKSFGITLAYTLTVAEVEDSNELRNETNLAAGDRIKSVNGKDVDTYQQLRHSIGNTFTPEAAVLADRNNELVEGRIELLWPFGHTHDINSESELYHICSMVPRLKISSVAEEKASIIRKLFGKQKQNKTGLKPGDIIISAGGIDKTELKPGDVILAAGGIDNPTYLQLREITKAYKDKDLQIKVLRWDRQGQQKTVTVTVKPYMEQQRVIIGIGVVLDAARPVIAQTVVTETGQARLEIPGGATITAVDGIEVADFYDIVRIINENRSQRISIDYRLNPQVAGCVVINAAPDEDFITVKPVIARQLPFEPLKRLYKADGPVEAIALGWNKTIVFIKTAYATIKGLLTGLIGPESLMGPVGILTTSYRVVSQKAFIEYVYLMALISAAIAVFNFLPLPPLDGGLAAMLLVEKVMGKPLNLKVQGLITNAGWVVIGLLFVYITFNDIARSWF